jgi:hypothetical protein
MSMSDIYHKQNPNLNIDTYLYKTPSRKILSYINNIFNRFYVGIIYCLTCESYKNKGKYKIGMTTDLSLSNLKKRYRTYFGGEEPEIIIVKIIGDPKNAEKLAHFIFKDYRINKTEWFCFGIDNYDIILQVVNYQFSYISYYYPTPNKYLEYMNNTLERDDYINLISNIYNTRENQEKHVSYLKK